MTRWMQDQLADVEVDAIVCLHILSEQETFWALREEEAALTRRTGWGMR